MGRTVRSDFGRGDFGRVTSETIGLAELFNWARSITFLSRASRRRTPSRTNKLPRRIADVVPMAGITTTQKHDGLQFKTIHHTHPSRITTGQNGHPLNAKRKRKRKRKRDSDGCVGSPATLNLDTTFTMSDEEHDVETFDTADAGASHTIPMQAGSVRKGGFMVRSRATSDLLDEWMNREPNLSGVG